MGQQSGKRECGAPASCTTPDLLRQAINGFSRRDLTLQCSADAKARNIPFTQRPSAMSLSKATALVILLVTLLIAACNSYPEVGSLTSLASRRPEDAHPFDLYQPSPALNFWPFWRQYGKITVNETSVDGTGRQWVRVRWSGVPSPHEEDILALFAAENWRQKAPLKAIYAAEDASYLHKGSGTVE